jgi:hypothetical protein
LLNSASTSKISTILLTGLQVSHIYYACLKFWGTDTLYEININKQGPKYYDTVKNLKAENYLVLYNNKNSYDVKVMQ